MEMLVKIWLVKQGLQKWKVEYSKWKWVFSDTDYFFVSVISSEKYCLDLKSWDLELYMTLHKKWSFPLRIFSVNCGNLRKLRI